MSVGKDMISMITDYDPEIRCDAGLTRAVEEVTIANSNGGGRSYKKSVLFGSLAATAIDGNDILDLSRHSSVAMTLTMRSLPGKSWTY